MNTAWPHAKSEYSDCSQSHDSGISGSSPRMVRPIIVCTLVSALVACSGFAALPNEEKATADQWTMVYEAGVALMRTGTRVSVTIREGTVILERKKGASFSIPAGAITAVSSSLASKRTASDAQAGVWAGAVSVSPYTLLLLPFGLAGMAATYPIKSHYAHVSILWNVKGTEQEVLLRLGRADYTPFLAELQKATGKEWKNLDTEWAKVQQELKREGANKIAVRLDRKVSVGKASLKPGAYQIAFLERGENRGELYFFPGNDVNIERLAAVALVAVVPAAREPVAEAVSYKQDKNGMTTVSGIRTPSKTFQFP